MNNSKVYLERMKGSLGEKLFFIDKIDLTDKIVVDFGCADGTLLNALREIYGDKCIYIGVEIREEFYDKAAKIADYMFKNLAEVEDFLTANSFTKEIVFLTSSVLHECIYFKQTIIKNFVEAFCDYWVIRDMYFKFDYDFNKTDSLVKIIEKSDFKQLKSFLLRYREITDEVLCEWLMKYPYVENWEQENSENYWSTSWYLIYSKSFKIIYDNIYINEFIKDRIKKDYDIDIKWSTHRQVILKVKKEEN